jgi:hypothetical protein
VHLDRRVGAADRRLRGKQLGDRGFGGIRLALILEVAGAPHEHAARVRLERHVGDHLLDELEGRDRSPELLAVLGVADRRIEAALADADAPGGDAVATRVE